MGVSNSGVVLTEKDLNSIGFNFLAKPTLEQFYHGDEDECVIGKKENEKEKEKEKEQEQEQEEEEKCKLKVSATTMELKISSLGAFKVGDDDEDGFKTPTSLDHRIPLIIPCPPAPRKPKSGPSTKRRAPAANRRVLLDLSNEIQSLFPRDFAGKFKRVRQGGV